MSLLTLNAGSSSLKFAVFSRDGRERRLTGHVDGVGRDKAEITIKRSGQADETRTLRRGGSHEGALQAALEIAGRAAGETVHAVGHRIVHGGARFSGPAEITAEVETGIEALVPLAPLHQPHNLEAVRTARSAFPGAVQVACFDTAFHRSHDFAADAFALPARYYDKGVRRYGFHGLSYQYLARALAEAEGRTPGRAVLCHLGSGASLCAIRDGVSCDSSMGFSALDGLPMATRCGQIDPGVLLYLMAEEGLDADALTDLLYKKSGLKGLSGTSGDMREIEQADTDAAKAAFDYFVARCRREIAAMCAALQGLDSLVFSAGVGEHSPAVRAAVCEGLGWLGVKLDPAANAAAKGAPVKISAAHSAVSVWMIPTDEEQVIAEAAARFVHP
ncbi:MAG: acetate/propionate family kinase [Oceanicaulis sp.]